MKLRTINKAYEELVKIDPMTSMTKYALRRMVIDGLVPSIKTGRKYLIDSDQLLDFLNSAGLAATMSKDDNHSSKTSGDFYRC